MGKAITYLIGFLIGIAVTVGAWLLNVWMVVQTAKWMGWL